MSSTNRKFVVAYIVLVGIPLLALAGVLKAGHHLSSPFAVDGSWKVESLGPPVSSACSSFLSSIASISVSQSGTVLVLGLNGKTTTGTLDGKSLRAQFPGSDDAAGCSDHSLTLAATVDPTTDPRSMAGSLSFSNSFGNCASCSIDFRAIRQPRPPSGGSH
ncbi:MAG TPA: hypothetical protein VGG04_06975 [Candidatus Sulfotelmatobacter sp.]